MPDSSNFMNPTVQVLTHRIGFKKTSMGRSLQRLQSFYTNVVTDQYKYCTLSFARLGASNSSQGKPLNETQAFLEVAATAQLTQMLRNGTFPGVNQTFSKIAHVDGIILTGFSMDASFVLSFAAGAKFQLANRNQTLRFRFSIITGQQVHTILSTYAELLLDYIAPIDLTAITTPQMLPNGYLLSSNAEDIKYLGHGQDELSQCRGWQFLGCCIAKNRSRYQFTLTTTLTGACTVMSDFFGLNGLQGVGEHSDGMLARKPTREICRRRSSQNHPTTSPSC
ncbi:hypothetical protein IFR05_008261 [Cadophora sp. M221]|nr:hypothetical protein IFR05_008261 [Cadophora sp. M221]